MRLGTSSLINLAVVEGQVRAPIEAERGPYGLRCRFTLRMWMGTVRLDIPCRCIGADARRLALLPRPYPRAVVSGRLVPSGGTGPTDPPCISILADHIVLGHQDAGILRDRPKEEVPDGA